MIPAPFDYAAASSLAEAIRLLAAREGARVLAGGQGLIPLLETRALRPPLLVDVGGLAELRGIARGADGVRIGALTTHRQLELADDLRPDFPILRQAALDLADPPVRNPGTFGGALAQADPRGDWPAVALALDARVHARGPDGERVIPIDELFVAP